MKLLCSLLLLVLAAALTGCSRQPAAEATPLPAPSQAQQPTPSPALALGLRKQGIVFHDLTQSEQVCPGFAEFLAPVEVSPEQIGDRDKEIVRQVRLICTNEEKGTVYFVDLENQTITVTRKLAPVPGMP
ncbi:MAG: hypothetical protein OXM03_07250 [Chloroflexota bacterium]|nr:hypothetical protein [Chloroflexota bacterium]MDE2840409.1 hypothetical protein [Chloroflexota bacterium]MDE2931824.1 hypothetical protein [Chloroflexota bacterium]